MKVKFSPKIKYMHRNIYYIITCLFCFSLVNVSSQNPSNPYKAPLYWDVYENNFLKEKAGVTNNYISEDEFLANINWIDTNMKSSGYNMICIDGWGDADYNVNGYRTKHSSAWAHDYAWWSAELQKRGMTLGIYNNPLWINANAANAGVKVKGTNILLSTLINNNENALWFKWLQVDRPGAEEYVKGYVQYYADMGVKFLRVDFLSWFESGYDRNIGTVGPDRRNNYINGLSYYETALKWMREACDANGMFLSLVMPNLYTDAVLEQKYGHMVRINEDCAEGGWYRFSDSSRGVHNAGWSQFANPFDGYVYWSRIAGRGKMILDGDFIRLNTYANDEERKCVVSLHLMTGGPISIADQYNTIGSNSWVYQNEELLTLNQDGFVGTPLSNDPTNSLNQVWKGRLTNGDWIVGFFNREGSAQTRSINFQNDLGISGNVFVRDLWSHTDIGSVSSLSRSVPAHGCLIFKIKANSNKVISPLFSIREGSYKTSCSVGLSTTTAGATIYYTLDGSVPTASSSLYIAPIIVSTTSTIKAVAIKNGMEDSYVNKAIYMIGEAKPQATINIGATFNNWTLSATPLKNTGGNNWTTDPITIPVGDQVMKFANTTNWSGDDWGNASGLNGTTQLTTGGGAFVSFTTPVAGKYLITFNDYTLAYNVKKTLDFVQSQMYVAGSFNSWSLSNNKMTLTDNNLWKSSAINLPAGTYQMKFANTSNWSGDDWGNTSGLSGVASLSTGGLPNINFTIPTAGKYIISFNDATLSYSISNSLTSNTEIKISDIHVLSSDNRIIVKLDKNEDALIEVIALDGQLLSKTQSASETTVINMKSQSKNSLVIIRVNTKSTTYSSKLILL